MTTANVPTRPFAGPSDFTEENGAPCSPRGESSTGEETASSSMALNVAYEALEDVRRANIELEFGQIVDSARCIPCLRSAARLSSNAETLVIPPQRRLTTILPRNRASPCLACGTPVCRRSSCRCSDVGGNNAPICVDCSKFLSLDFLADAADDPDRHSRKRLMDAMLDAYDRSLLVLRYSVPFLDAIASELEHHTKRRDKIGLGSSATNLTAGLAGVAAAATIFTPAGPPLLLASILFGSGATAASAGSDAAHDRSKPVRAADRILILRGLVLSLSRLVVVVPPTPTSPLLEENGEDAGTKAEIPGASSGDGDDDEILGSPTAVSVDAMESTASPDTMMTASQSSPMGASSPHRTTKTWTRATANALKPLTAGALSAASVVMEAREIRSTLKRMQKPDEKAAALRSMKGEAESFPDTAVLARECRRYFWIDEDL